MNRPFSYFHSMIRDSLLPLRALNSSLEGCKFESALEESGKISLVPLVKYTCALEL